MGALLGWGALGIATIGFVWFLAVQLAPGWEGREQEALERVKKFQSSEMKYSLADQTIAVGNAARAKGHFVGEFHWNATQENGPTYKVELIWKEDSATKKATWFVDLEQEEIKPQGEQASEFMKPVEEAG
jgi:hypothetical protein